MPIRTVLVILCFSFLFVACAPQKPLTPEEQLMRDAQNECVKDANSLIDPPHSSVNPFWNSYFRMCMKTRFGYTNEELRKIWY